MKAKICKAPGCQRTSLPDKNFCDKHKALEDQQRKIFTRRGKSSAWNNLYHSAEWRKRSKEFLRKYPTCFICGRPSQITDHITPHRGDLTLFWNEDNWQPMCWSCHSRKTFRENNNFRGVRK